MPLNFLETVHYKLRALTGANPVHDIGVGFADLAEDVDKALYEGNKVAAGQGYQVQTYTKAEAEAGIKPSAARSAFVSLSASEESTANASVTIEGDQVAVLNKKGSASFVVAAGNTWKCSLAAGNVTASTILL